MSKTLTIAAVLVGAAFFVVTGAWAFAAPHSFFTTVAGYPPYNRHLFHDVGALSLGIGAGLLFGLTRARGIVVGLGGAAVGATLHAVAHWIDRGQGGRASDPWLLSLFALVLVAGALAAAQRDRVGRPTE